MEMLEAGFLTVGLFIVFYIIFDILWTTLWIDGDAGPLTTLITNIVWTFHKNTIGRINIKFLSLSGALLLFEIVASWIIILFIGWLLIFLSNERSVMDTQTGATSDFTDKVYFVAYSLFTLGNGDFKPAEGIWQIATPCITASGFFTITLSVTYLLSVLSAAVNKRNVAGEIVNIGETAQKFTLHLLRSNYFHSLDLQLSEMNTKINTLHGQYKAFPILHFFHATEYQKSITYALAVVHDAICILEYGIDESQKPSPSILFRLKRTLNEYIEMLISKQNIETVHSAPGIDMDILKKEGVKVADTAYFADKILQLRDRRSFLLAMIENEGWRWYTEHR